MAQFELPTTSTEVEEVCETWTGSDYAFSSTTLSESDSDPNVPEDVLRADFSNGQLTPMSGSGTPIDAPTAVDPTLFDLVNASQDLRDASFDEPYYGIYGGGGGGGGGDECPPSDPYCNNETNVVQDLDRPDAPRRFTRHNLGRRGVRALVDKADELPPTARGERRFRRQVEGGRVTYTVDPATQLILEEDHELGSSRSVSRHTWEKQEHGYVRALTMVTHSEQIDGHLRTTRTTIRISNLHLNGERVQREPVVNGRVP